MINANVSVQASLITPANEFVVAIYLQSAPTVLVQKIIPTKPYDDPFGVTFTNLTFGSSYNLKLWESPDGSDSGVLRNSSNFTAQGQQITIRPDLHIYGDGSGFASGQPSYVDSSVVGWTFRVIRIGQGPLDPNSAAPNGLEVTYNSNGFTLPVNVNTGEHFVLEFDPQLTALAPAPASLISTGITVTADTVFDNTYKNMDVLIQATTNHFTGTLPSLATVADYDIYQFRSYGGSQKNARLQCVGTDEIQLDTLVTKIVLGQKEVAIMFKADGVWNIQNELSGFNSVGTIRWSQSPALPGYLPLNGQTVDATVYERLYDYLNSESLLISGSTWANSSGGNFPNKGHYAITGTTLRLPLASNAGLFKLINGIGGRTGGDFQDWQVLAHQHGTASGSSGTSLFGRWATTLALKLFGSSSTTNNPDQTSGMTDSTGALITKVGTEPYEKNTGYYAHVKY